MKRSAIYVLSALILCSCSQDTKPDTVTSAVTAASETAGISETSDTEASSSVSAETETTAKTAALYDTTLAERMTGGYSCVLDTDGTEQLLRAEIFDFYGNIYAYCSISENIDGSYEEMSLWTAELIPSEAGAFERKDTDTCETGVLLYSPMSNAGRYWSVPDTGTLTVNDDGIVLDGADLMGMGKGSTVLRRDDEVSFCETFTGDVPDGLCGLWVTYDDNSTPLFYDMRVTDSGNEMTVYSKAAGREAEVYKGGFTADDTGISMKCTNPGGPPLEESCAYHLDSDKLTLSSDDGNRFFERVTVDAVPLVYLARPDDVSALKGGDLNGRALMPQYRMCDDVENNGGCFVRIGDLIYYRVYDEHSCGLNSYGNFIGSAEICENSRICWYDQRTGETGTAFEDNSTDGIYYMNGMFWLYTAPPYGEDSRVYRCFPDGSAEETIETGRYAYIRSVSENNDRIYIDRYSEDSTRSESYVTDGFGMIYEPEISGDEYVAETVFAGSDAVLLLSDISGNDRGLRIVQYTDSDMTELGRISYTYNGLGIISDDMYGMDSCEQILSAGDKLYFVIGWYIGDYGEPFDEAVLSVQKGKENSLELVSNAGDVEKLQYIYEENGEIHFTDHIPGNIGLTNGTYGDLVYFDAPDSSVMLIKDHTPKQPYGFDAGLEHGEKIPLLQSAEYINGAAYIITADGLYDPVSYVDGFDLEDMTWLRIKDGKEEQLAYISVTERREKAYREYEKLLAQYKQAAADGALPDDSLGILFEVDGLNADGSGYILRDVDYNGIPELIIMDGGTISGIHSFDGEKAITACFMNENAVLYESGAVIKCTDSSDTTTETILRPDRYIGYYLPEAEKLTDKNTGKTEYYSMCGSHGTVREDYARSGSLPVYAFEWSGEMTEPEFGKVLNDYSDKEPMELPEPVPFADFGGTLS